MFTCIECENTFDDLTGNVDERICNSCMESEKEYEVNVTGCFTVVAESQEDADRFIRNQLQDGVTDYVCSLEIGEEE